MEQIPRNAEEQEALEALDSALSVVPLNDDRFAIADAIERELLARGYAITKIPTVMLDADGQCSCDHHGDHAGCDWNCHN